MIRPFQLAVPILAAVIVSFARPVSATEEIIQRVEASPPALTEVVVNQVESSSMKPGKHSSDNYITRSEYPLTGYFFGGIGKGSNPDYVLIRLYPSGGNVVCLRIISASRSYQASYQTSTNGHPDWLEIKIVRAAWNDKSKLTTEKILGVLTFLAMQSSVKNCPEDSSIVVPVYWGGNEGAQAYLTVNGMGSHWVDVQVGASTKSSCFAARDSSIGRNTIWSEFDFFCPIERNTSGCTRTVDIALQSGGGGLKTAPTKLRLLGHCSH